MKRFISLFVLLILLGMPLTGIEAGEVRSNSLQYDSFFSINLAIRDNNNQDADFRIRTQRLTLIDVINRIHTHGNTLVRDSGTKPSDTIPQNLQDNLVTIQGNNAFVKINNRVHQINIAGDINAESADKLQPQVKRNLENTAAEYLNLSGKTPTNLQLSFTGKNENEYSIVAFKSLLTGEKYISKQFPQKTPADLRFDKIIILAHKSQAIILEDIQEDQMIDSYDMYYESWRERED